MLTDEQSKAVLDLARQVEQDGTLALDAICDELESLEAAACAPLLERIAHLEATASANYGRGVKDGHAHADERIAELEAKLAQRVPDGWKLVPPSADDSMLQAFAETVAPETDWHGSSEADRQEVRDGFNPAYRAMLAAAPAAPEQQEFDDCSQSPSGKHSESWFANGDCEYCKTGAQPNAPLFYPDAAQAPNAQQAGD